ncbi:MAG: tRNA pseudouridine(55) synthase TruB [Clostridia bacterium]|nr:tRNA pseudouridine(55) synthase TruB [Clostridia bacterium]
MNGIINVLKPEGITSFDVIYKVRRILNTRRIGHTGTLDPMASGVLPICVGKATRAAELIVASDKEYICRLKFGAETDTQDSTGEILKTSDKRPEEAEFLETLNAFTGEIEQIPPMYSAVHVGGERLYKIARRGETVERKPRKITIFDITPLSFTADEAEIKIICSKGTYIRTLCEDIGKKLGSLAHMTALKRTRSGIFKIEDAVSVEDVCEEKLTPVDELFSDYEKIVLSGKDEFRVRNGAAVLNPLKTGKKYRLYGADGSFLCLSEGIEENGTRLLSSIKNFY